MFFFFKQKTAYELRISDWSSDVCSSDLHQGLAPRPARVALVVDGEPAEDREREDDQRDRDRIDEEIAEPLRRDDVDIAIGEDEQERLSDADPDRSEERRVGKECVRTCRSLGCRYH